MKTPLLFLLGALALPAQEPPLRLAIAGLVHGHVDGFLRAARGRNVVLVGVQDADTALHKKYAARYGLAENVFFTDLGVMLDNVKPEAVACFSSTFDHRAVVEAAAARRIPVMMEKPLAVSMEHARAIERAGVPVIVNFETTWYRSHAAIWRLVKEQQAMGRIRKMVAMDGHQGPREINVQPEFFEWLTDPLKNGAGALFDFGCYGANLMTWLMDNRRPIAVTAVTQRFKPTIYPRVDDEANLLVEYADAVGIIEASWNWPFNRKDLEVYAEKGAAFAVGGNILRLRLPGETGERAQSPEALPADQADSIAYLTAVVRGRLKPSGLSSLENNMIVTEILDAARESARTGRRVVLDDSRPNFSGNWTLDLNRSRLEVARPSATSLKVEHSGADFRLSATHRYGEKSRTVDVKLEIGGAEAVTREAEGVQIRSRLYWDGNVLVLDAWWPEKEGRGTNVVHYSLSPDGRTFTADERESYGGKTYHNLWVFTRN